MYYVMVHRNLNTNQVHSNSICNHTK